MEQTDSLREEGCREYNGHRQQCGGGRGGGTEWMPDKEKKTGDICNIVEKQIWVKILKEKKHMELGKST